LQTSITVVLPIYRRDEVREFNCFSLSLTEVANFSVFYVVCRWLKITDSFHTFHTSRRLHSGDVADDRFFHKTNDSDATQFYFLYPSIGPHSLYSLPSCFSVQFIRASLSMGCVLGIFFGRCVGGFCFLRYLGFQGAASLALKAIPPH
jgi:hypothetical protein